MFLLPCPPRKLAHALRRRQLALILFLFPLFLSAAPFNSDSLERALKQETPSVEQWKGYRQLLSTSLYINPVKSERYAEAMLESAEALDNDSLIAASYTDLGMVHVRLNHYEEAITFLTQALQRAEVVGDSNLLIRTHINLSAAHLNHSKHAEGHKELFAARDLINPNTPRHYQQTIFNNLGGVYKSMDNYREALEMYEKARQVAEPADIRSRAMIAANMGSVYIQLENLPRALEYAQLAINLAQGTNFHEQLAYAFGVQSRAERKLGNIALSRAHLDSMITHSEASGVPFRIQLAKEEEAKFFAETRDYRSAYFAFRSFTAYKDSLQEIVENERIRELRERMDLKEENLDSELRKAKMELQLSEEKRANEKWLIMGIAGGMLLLGVGLVIIALILLKRSRKTPAR